MDCILCIRFWFLDHSLNPSHPWVFSARVKSTEANQCEIDESIVSEKVIIRFLFMDSVLEHVLLWDHKKMV